MLLAVIAVALGAAAGLLAGRRPSAATGRPSAATGCPSAGTGRPSAGTGRPSAATGCPSAATGRPSAPLLAGGDRADPRPADVALLAAGVGVSLAGGRVAGTVAALAVTLAGYALLVVFAVRHRRHPGMVVIAAGLLSNLVVMATDRGMPVGTLAAGAARGLHHGLAASDHLRGLADVIALPGLGLTVSPGDLVLSLGGAIAAFAWLAPRGRVSGPAPLAGPGPG